jgi:uncharacterized protein
VLLQNLNLVAYRFLLWSLLPAPRESIANQEIAMRKRDACLTCRIPFIFTIVSMLTVACAGERGPQGETGANGINGAPGLNGMNGTNGMNATGPDSGTLSSQSPKTISFESVNAPTNDSDKRKNMVGANAVVNGVAVPLAYHVELRSGQMLGGQVFGRLTDKDGNALKGADGSEQISPSNDFSSLLKVGSKIFEITHFETTPAAMYLTELQQNAAGTLTPLSTRPIDFSSVGGLWTPCAGSVTPWSTHLGSEEYPSDARQAELGTTPLQVVGNFSGNLNMLRYFGLNPALATVDEVRAVYRPYRYGFPVEVTVNQSGETTVRKHFSAGRRALELAYVMPDKKSVYLTDDGANDMLSMFIAKTPGDLSEGRLFAARWFQTSANGAPDGHADIYWIELGPSATDAEVKALVESNVKFSDIFEWEAFAAGTCPSAATGFKAVNTDSGGVECLKLKPGQELAASRLETRRYAAYLGATTEFRKTEGITFNPEDNMLYISFSELNRGTKDNDTYDTGGPNHIRLAENRCGAVYEFALLPDGKLGSNYVAVAAISLVEGVWLGGKPGNPYPSDSPYFGKNSCSVNHIANPDNLSYLPGYHMLLIGEDATEEHQNDALWAFDTTSGKSTRIMTTPYGAEVTGTYWYPNLNGFGYLKVQVQHPYGESDQAEAASDPAGASAVQSYTGYLGPFPSLQ